LAFSQGKKIAVLIGACVGWFEAGIPASAWSLKTHVWIAQQIINDAADGQLAIAGGNYALPPHVLNALRLHPDRYRMGSLGPDVFPDPVVGQMTTHPGIDGGWHTDDWLKHLLTSAGTPEEIAFAYGFVAHAAGDIFAHSYVNAYAGDIFLLTDGEREVELRHFVLEKYIESLTPQPAGINGVALDWGRDLGSPSSFLRDTLIFGGDVSKQNFASKAGYHLTSMHEVRHAVGELQKGSQDVIGSLTKWGAQYFQQQIKLQIDLASGKAAVETAKAAVAAEEGALQLKRQAYQAALDALGTANDIIQKNPQLITHNEDLLAAQITDAANKTAEATRIGAEAADAINDLNNQISDWADKLSNLICKLPLGGLNRACEDLERDIKGARSSINGFNLASQAANEARDVASRLRDETIALVQRLKGELEKAVKGVAENTYQAAILAAETQVKAEEKLLELKKKAVIEAEALSNKLSKELEKNTLIVDDIKKAIDRYNPVTVVIQKWLDDIGVGTEEYIKASHRAGLLMLQNSGNPLKEYQDWYACYGQVFKAIPKEIGQAGCLVRNFVQDVQNEFDKFMDGLPEIVRWIIDPTREVKRRVKEKVKPELEKATFRIVGFLTDPKTADFLELLTHPKNATREKLVDTYRRDESRKGLLEFSDVASVVEKDLHIEGGVLTPEKFAPLTHAVTLAKIALLAPDELNRLVRDLAGATAVIPSDAVYPPYNGNFSVLLDSVKSIDGNHQWQAYGLPYPRRLGVSHDDPGGFDYGRDGFSDKNKGLRFWTDVYLRERVFLKLFPEGVLGALGERPELKQGHYKFPSCAQNPFPKTQDPDTGVVLKEDKTCTNVSMPDRKISEFQSATEAEYRDRYFQCDKPILGLPHWTIAGSYLSEINARHDSTIIRRLFPDMAAEVWRPQTGNKYWTIMIAACTTSDRANEARDIAIRRGIGRDAFTWHPHLPWAAAKPASVGKP
jgi:hypothetical protein